MFVLVEDSAEALASSYVQVGDLARVGDGRGQWMQWPGGGFIPPAQVKDLQDLVSYRTKLVQSRTAEMQRLCKALEDAGIKLDSVASQVLGKSGRLMIEALIDGERRGAVLADLAQGRLRSKIPTCRWR